jgi:hypothetical protein
VGTQRSFLPTVPDAGLRALAGRLTDLSNRLLALTSATDADVAALLAADVVLDGRLDTAETDIAALEAADTALDGRLDVLEALPVTGTYTPALTGMAIGTGGGALNTADFVFDGETLFVHGEIKFGTSGTTFPGATITVGLPSGYEMPATTVTVSHPMSEVTFIDLATNVFAGLCRREAGTDDALRLLLRLSSGTYGGYAATSTTVPHTWAAGDEIEYWYRVFADPV